MGQLACCVGSDRKEAAEPADKVVLKKYPSGLAFTFTEMVKERHDDIREVYDFVYPPLGKGTKFGLHLDNL